MSGRLQAAADYVVQNPIDVATRSLRAISVSSGIAPATFSRLARALGYDTYEEMRELSRSRVERRGKSFAERVQQLQAEALSEGAAPFLIRQAAACIENIGTLAASIPLDRLEQAVARLDKSRNVVLVGAFGSTGIVEYFAYIANYFSSNWSLAGRGGASLSTSLGQLGPEDAVVIVTKPPFARRAITAAEIAREQGAYVVVISDTHVCPAFSVADAGFTVATDSPQFFSSYAATLVLIETMIGMLVAKGGQKARDRISMVETQNRRLGEFWTG